MLSRLLIAVLLTVAAGCGFLAPEKTRHYVQYQVRSGDTLYSIGQRLNVSVIELQNINRVHDPRSLYAGQILQVPSSGESQPSGGRSLSRALKVPLHRASMRTVKLAPAKQYVGTMFFPLPSRSWRYSSGFSWRWSSFHEGLDLSAPTGTPIYAAHAGRVVYSSDGINGYGNLVAIRGVGLLTVYAHQSRLLVDAGDEVEQGEILGEVGQTGHASGPHLHFETRVWDPERKGYVAVDPRVFYRS